MKVDDEVRSSLIRVFWHVIDTGGLVCQIVFYPYFVMAGILMISTGPPTTVNDALGPLIEQVWIWTLILSPLVVLLGARLCNRFIGVSIEVGANITLMCSLLCYAIAITQAAWLDKGAFSPWLALGVAEMVFLICVRDYRRLIRADRKLKRRKQA